MNVHALSPGGSGAPVVYGPRRVLKPWGLCCPVSERTLEEEGDPHFRRMLDFAQWAMTTYGTPKPIKGNRQYFQAFLVRLGKELEFHAGSAAHVMFGIRNMAVISSRQEYAILGGNFAKMTFKLVIILLLLLSHATKLPLKLVYRYGAPVLTITAPNMHGTDSLVPSVSSGGMRR